MKTKRLLLLLCLLCLTISLAVVGAAAAEIVDSGLIDNGVDMLYWSLGGDGQLTISGKGVVRSGAPWETYSASVTRIVIGDGVTKVDDSAFFGYSNLISVSIPGSVTHVGNYAFAECRKMIHISLAEGIQTIGASAFYNCSSLTSVILPEGVTTIRTELFYQCSALTTVYLPDSITAIGEYSFYGCTKLTSVNLPNDVTEIGYSAFNGCSSLVSVNIPDGITILNNATFSGCSSLTSVVIPEGVTQIGSSVFSGCSGLAAVTIPQSVTTISDYAFSGCSGLTEIAIPQAVTELGTAVFSGCEKLTSVVIPEGISSIGENTFSYCYALTSVTLPQSVTRIGENAFLLCRSLVSLTIPDAVTTIGKHAFWSCQKLEEITIPENVTYIGETAFQYCESLRRIRFTGNPPQIGAYTFEYVTATAYYPGEHAGWTEAAQQDYGGQLTWRAWTSIIASGKFGADGDNLGWYLEGSGLLTVYGTGDMGKVPWSTYNAQIKQVTMEYGVTDIAARAFTGCTNLTAVSIPSSVTAIGLHAFRGCSSLTSVEIPYHGLLTIGNEAFGDCTALTDLEIPGTVTTIEPWAFYNCSSLTSVSLPNLTTIGSSTFRGCTALTNITLPMSLTEIGMFAFMECSNLAWVHIPESVTVIGRGAFDSCTALTSVSIPSGVTKLDFYTFFGCSSLETVYWPDGLTEIGEAAFYECSGLTELYLPSSVTTIGLGAFQDCTGLTQITIPENVTTLEEQAFFGCSAVKTITFLGAPPSFGDRAFGNMTAVAYYPADNSLWTADVCQNYGGSITWYPNSYHWVVFRDWNTELLSSQWCRYGDPITIPADPVRPADENYTYTFLGWEPEVSPICLGDVLYNPRYEANATLKITQQPTTTYTKLNSTAKVTVKAEGSGLTYTWYFKNAGSTKFSKSSVTSATYSVKMTDAVKNRQVYCVVKDQNGNTVQTDTVYLRQAASVVTQPKTTYTKLNGTAKVTVKASGDGLTYTWYIKNASSSKFTKSSVTSATYTAKMTDKVKNRQVYCVVKDKYGKTVTTETVYLRQAASIVTQPKTTYTKLNGTAKVTVKASGDGLTYTWYFKNAGASKFSKSSVTSATYSAKMTDKVKNRQVYCVVKDKYGKTVQTDTVYLRQAASITTQPKTTYTKLNGTAKVTVKASGDGLTYTWYFKNAGASKFSKSSVTSATYSAKMTDKVKNRQVYCVVKDKYGKTVQTDTVYLRQAASITTQPKTTYTKLGGTAKVTVKASGDGLTYTWYTKNVGATKYSKSSVTAATYSVKMTEKVKDRYVYCVVKDKYGNEVKTETVRLRMAASISKQPVNVTAAKGAKATVKLTAMGDGLTYKWYYKDAGGKTFKLTSTFKSSTYSLTMSKSNSGRQVYCVVTDKYGNSVKSNTVTLKMK